MEGLSQWVTQQSLYYALFVNQYNCSLGVVAGKQFYRHIKEHITNLVSLCIHRLLAHSETIYILAS